MYLSTNIFFPFYCFLILFYLIIIFTILFFLFFLCFDVFFFFVFFFFFSSRRRHTRCLSDWSSDVCSSDLVSPSGRGARGSPEGPAELEGRVEPRFELLEHGAFGVVERPRGARRSAENTSGAAPCGHLELHLEERSEERRVGKEERCGWSRR